MKFSATICALAGLAAASSHDASPVEKRQAAGSIPLSIELVLFTALPSSLLAVAETNTAAVSAAIASEFAAGTGAPAWFKSLPTDVQTYLVPASAIAAIEASATATSGSNITTAPGAVITSAAQNSTALSGLGAIPVILNATTTANGTVYANATAVAVGTGAVGTGGVGGVNGTGVAGPYANTTSMTMAGMMTKASSSAAGATAVGATTAAAASSSKAPSGNAGVAGVAVPTGVLGAGLAGLVGVVGVLAL